MRAVTAPAMPAACLSVHQPALVQRPWNYWFVVPGLSSQTPLSSKGLSVCMRVLRSSPSENVVEQDYSSKSIHLRWPAFSLFILKRLWMTSQPTLKKPGHCWLATKVKIKTSFCREAQLLILTQGSLRAGGLVLGVPGQEQARSALQNLCVPHLHFSLL